MPFKFCTCVVGLFGLLSVVSFCFIFWLLTSQDGLTLSVLCLAHF